MFNIKEFLIENKLTKVSRIDEGVLKEADYDYLAKRAAQYRKGRFGDEFPVYHTILGMVLGYKNLTKKWGADKNAAWKNIASKEPGGSKGNRMGLYKDVVKPIDDKYMKLTAQKMVEDMSKDEIQNVIKIMNSEPEFVKIVSSMLKGK